MPILKPDFDYEHDLAHTLPGAFPKPVIRGAYLLANRVLSRELYADREEVYGFTIDKDGTVTIDDAILLEIDKETGDYVISVSISDIPAMIPKGSYLDIDALYRGKANDSIRLFPGGIDRRALSIFKGKKRPTVTFEIRLNKDLDVKAFRLRKTYIKSSGQLSKSEANTIIEAEDHPDNYVLGSYYHMATALKNKRTGGSHNGVVDKADQINREFMLLANRELAKKLAELGVRAFFFDNKDVNGPYLRATSPLIDYRSVVNLRIAKAVLIDGQPSPYTREELELLDRFLRVRQAAFASLRNTAQTAKKTAGPLAGTSVNGTSATNGAPASGPSVNKTSAGGPINKTAAA